MRVLFLLAVLMTVASAHAELYRWTDEAGRVHFSDQPPADQPAESMEAKGPPQLGQGESVKRIHQRVERLREAESQRERELQAKADEEHRLASQRNEHCTRVRKRLTNYVGRIYDSENDAFLTDAQIETDRQQMQQWLNENCKGY